MTVSGDTTAPVQKAGVFEDLIDVFVRPARLFDRERRGSFAKPALIQMIIMGVLAIALHNLIAPYMDAEMARQTAKQAAAMAAKGQTMPESAVAMQEKIGAFTSYVGPFLAPWLIGIIGGLLVFLASRIVGAKPTYSQSALIASWSFMPAILGMIVMAVQGALVDATTVRGVSDAQLGPARLLDPNTASPALLALLQQLDVFGIWSIVLAGIGISVVANVSRTTGMLAAIIRFAIYALLVTAPALLFS